MRKEKKKKKKNNMTLQSDMRSILKKEKKIGYFLNAHWIFTSPLEKIGLVILGLLGMWKIFGFFF